MACRQLLQEAWIDEEQNYPNGSRNGAVRNGLLRHSLAALPGVDGIRRTARPKRQNSGARCVACQNWFSRNLAGQNSVDQNRAYQNLAGQSQADKVGRRRPPVRWVEVDMACPRLPGDRPADGKDDRRQKDARMRAFPCRVYPNPVQPLIGMVLRRRRTRRYATRQNSVGRPAEHRCEVCRNSAHSQTHHRREAGTAFLPPRGEQTRRPMACRHGFRHALPVRAPLPARCRS